VTGAFGMAEVPCARPDLPRPGAKALSLVSRRPDGYTVRSSAELAVKFQGALVLEPETGASTWMTRSSCWTFASLVPPP
jgi:hypothetical protein